MIKVGMQLTIQENIAISCLDLPKKLLIKWVIVSILYPKTIKRFCLTQSRERERENQKEAIIMGLLM